MIFFIFGLIIGDLLGMTIMCLVFASKEDYKDYVIEEYQGNVEELEKWYEQNKKNIETDYDEGYKDGLEYAVILMGGE